MKAKDFAITHCTPAPINIIRIIQSMRREFSCHHLPSKALTAFSRDDPQPNPLPATTMLNPCLTRALNSGCVSSRQCGPLVALSLICVKKAAGASWVRNVSSELLCKSKCAGYLQPTASVSMKSPSCWIFPLKVLAVGAATGGVVEKATGF